jgi:hypothetical protein
MPTVRTRRVHRPISLLPRFCSIRHGANDVTLCPFLSPTAASRTARCLLTKEWLRSEDGRYERTNECVNTISTVLIAVDVKELVPDVETPRIPGADVPARGETDER